MPSILSDLSLGDPALKDVMSEGLEDLFEGMEPHLPSRPGVTERQQALATIALLFGTMTLARATASQPLSDEFLEAARAFLLRPEGSERPRK
jgi:TetR/AcrR family transcriptional repressor of nem operon